MSTYTTFLPFDSSNQANSIAWAQGISNAVANFGWVKTADLGQVDFSTLPTAFALQILNALPGAFDKNPPITNTQNFLGAWSSLTTYANGSTFNTQLCDVVTHAGATWINVSAGQSNHEPGTDINFWRMCNYEIWKSTGPKSSTNAIYLKIMYAATEDYGTPRVPRMFIGVATGSDGNGNLAGNLFNAGQNPPYFQGTGYGTGLGTAGQECNFSGDTDNLRWILYRSSINSGASTTALIIDRSKNQTGQDTDEYTTVCMAISGNIGSSRMHTFFRQAHGGVNIIETSKWTTVHLLQTSYAGQGGVPAFPIFPIIGALGNPLLGAVIQCAADTSEGAILKVSLYGSLHTYLVTKWPGVNNAAAVSSAVGIRWE